MTKYRRYRNRLRLKLISALGGKCRDCSENRPSRLQFAHLEPTAVVGRGRGKWRRLLDVKKNQDKYVLLCRPCHAKVDGFHPNWDSSSGVDEDEYEDYFKRRYGSE